MKTCPQCDTRVTQGDTCPMCGASVEANDSGDEVLQFANEEAAKTPPPFNESKFERVDFAVEIKRSERVSLLLMVSIVLLLVAVGAAVGELFLGGYYDVGMLIAGVVGIGAVIGAWYGGDAAILRMAKAKPADPVQDLRLINVVDEMRLAAGLPMPKVYVIETRSLNAFATGRSPENATVAVTRGLYKKLDREQLQAVVAHEIGHIRNLDIRYMMLVTALVGAIVMITEVMRRHWWWFGGSGRGRGSQKSGDSSVDSGNPAVKIAVIVLSIVLILLAPLFAKLLQLSISRKREYLADASAVEFTRNPLALASALRALQMHRMTPSELLEEMGEEDDLDKNKTLQPMFIINPLNMLKSQKNTIFSTHPPLEDRIAKLEAMA